MNTRCPHHLGPEDPSVSSPLAASSPVLPRKSNHWLPCDKKALPLERSAFFLWLGTFAVLVEDLSSVPSSYIRELTVCL